MSAADAERVSLESVQTHAVGENPDDLRSWVLNLKDGPGVTHVQVHVCREAAAHGDERPFWFFAEADPRHGVARLRCVACGQAQSLFDSDERWTYPTMHACTSCQQSMVEVAIGVHAETDEGQQVVTWAVVGARCVMCGRLEGLTDVVLNAPYPALEDIDAIL